ncbi:GNAT family N-acetyltransferase [Acidisphaera sp. S103]|uniref:GNAT family N-acetyltransferase n=1 Tax=Acidisphaera sp. S103 TaxID=1747223 RepID=UPI00131C0A70|nr:GNAT family N-acetyltransferase [Acidisphaera sp. S103]
MDITRDDRVRMERAHVLAWPALNTETIDGWLWRSSGGGSQRANSVSTIDFHGTDLDGSITKVEARYQALGHPVRFQTFDETSPQSLPDTLRRRGYAESEATITMFKRAVDAGMPSDVEVRDHAWPEWRSVYLGEITESRRAINALILDRIPTPSAFFGCQRTGEIIATALCVVGFGCAVIECVATRGDRRRQGAAQSVLTALETWAAKQTAAWIGLQVVASNTPAIALYERLGFVAGATNRFWVR